MKTTSFGSNECCRQTKNSTAWRAGIVFLGVRRRGRYITAKIERGGVRLTKVENSVGRQAGKHTYVVVSSGKPDRPLGVAYVKRVVQRDVFSLLPLVCVCVFSSLLGADVHEGSKVKITACSLFDLFLLGLFRACGRNNGICAWSVVA